MSVYIVCNTLEWTTKKVRSIDHVSLVYLPVPLSTVQSDVVHVRVRADVRAHLRFEVVLQVQVHGVQNANES